MNKYDIENAYILSRSNGKEHIVALSNKDNYKEDYVFDEKMNVALDAGSLQISDIYQDEYGIHKSIFIPFKNTDILFGLDMDASFISKLQTETLWICIIMTVIFILLGIIVAYFISIGITKPIKK